MSDTLLIESRGAVVLVTLNWPEKLNAINNELAGRPKLRPQIQSTRTRFYETFGRCIDYFE